MDSQQKADTVITLLLEMVNDKQASQVLADTFIRRILELNVWERFKVLGFFKTLGGRILGTKL